jgi:toxin ParE1/3/4
MPNARPDHRYRLTPQAVSDLEAIWTYSAETWSVGQADTYADDLTQIFDMIATLPGMAREYSEFSTPVRIHTHKSHVIVYAVKSDHVAIIRVLGGRQDWQTILQNIDP